MQCGAEKLRLESARPRTESSGGLKEHLAQRHLISAANEAKELNLAIGDTFEYQLVDSLESDPQEVGSNMIHLTPSFGLEAIKVTSETLTLKLI